jgi:hypothetical protein
MVLVRSVRTWRSTPAGSEFRGACGRIFWTLVDDGDDVGAGLALDVEDDGGVEGRPRGLGGGSWRPVPGLAAVPIQAAW